MTDKLMIDRELVEELIVYADRDTGEKLRNLPAAKVLDLSQIVPWKLTETLMYQDPDGEWVKVSDLTNAVLPASSEVVSEEALEALEVVLNHPTVVASMFLTGYVNQAIKLLTRKAGGGQS